MTERKRYLGDSVYIEIENGMFKLTTNNGFGPTNTIYLEPDVYDALNEFASHFLVRPRPTESQS